MKMRNLTILSISIMAGVATAFAVAHAQAAPSGCYNTSSPGQAGFTLHCPVAAAPVVVAAVPDSTLVSTSTGASVYRIVDSDYGTVCYVVPMATVDLPKLYTDVVVPSISCVKAD